MGEAVGVQPLGTKMEQRILEPFLFQPIKRGTLEKPVLIVTITGARPTALERSLPIANHPAPASGNLDLASHTRLVTTCSSRLLKRGIAV